MAITKLLTPYVGELPLYGVQAQSAFIARAEYSWTWLATNIVADLNIVVSQVNSTETNINAKEASAVSAATNAATSAATATAAANRAQSVVIPTNAAYATVVQDWRDTAMSKAQFNALASERRANRAGSGFDEWGKTRSSQATINDGMGVLSTGVNFVYLGDSLTSPSPLAGQTSKTSQPYISTNGIVHNISFVGANDINTVRLPSAPTILPFGTTLTAEKIASGVVTHADASNSGLIVNGKFDTDTSGWTEGNGATLSANAGNLRITNGIGQGWAGTSFPTVIGKTYTFELDTRSSNEGLNRIWCWVGSTLGSSTLYRNDHLPYNTHHTITFIATTTTSYIRFYTNTASVGNYVEVDNIAVFPSDAISRSDLVFLESWHEDVSEKDFVYPLGNVQYLGTTGDSGTPVAGAFAGFGTYSLFGNWQASSALVGKGYVWSTLSDANKKAFVANPENNCYLDGDKVIQVRYRMRVICAPGDSWMNMAFNTLANMDYSHSLRLTAKGKQVSVLDITGLTGYNYLSYNFGGRTGSDIGAFRQESLTGTNASYNAMALALPLAIVHRRNQGFSHPVYNPNGTELASDGNKWYNTAVSFTSIADCFTDTKLLATSGYIGTTSGRADNLFYDQVHEGDITDLRNSSQKVEDYNRLTDREFNKAVAGTVRGTEGEWGTERALQTSTLTTATGIFLPTASLKLSIGDSVYFYNEFDSTFKKVIVATVSTNDFTYLASYGTFNRQTGSYLLISCKSTRTKSNTLTHTDIIGSPANYPTAWKQSGVSGTPLIVAEDGTSLLPTGSLAVFKLSRKTNAGLLQVLRSTNSGATWTALSVTTHYTFSTTTNAITMVTAPATTDLIMVTYQTHTNIAVPAVNSEVLAIGDAWASNHVTFPEIVASLIGKVSTGALAPVTVQGYSTYGYRVHGTALTFSVASTEFPITSPMTLGGAVGVPTAKVFPYLTRSNGKAWLQLVFKEMKFGSFVAPTVDTGASISHVQYATYQVSIAGCPLDGEVVQWTAATATAAINWALYNKNADGSLYVISSGAAYANAKMFDGNSWGDDSKFNIVDNVSTTTDDNGQQILIGTKRIELNYFIGASE
jgi:hypothetical protein